jgi:phosphoenolpyruvate carboxylase
LARNPATRSKKQDPDSALVEDIRLLGRILGDVIREQEGVDVFNLIETIRTLSVRFHRHSDEQANKSRSF